MRRWGPLLGFVALTIFYAVTSPENRTDADDAYWYAAELRDAAWPELLHPLHLLYLPMGRVLWQVFRATGLQVDAHAGLVLFSALGTAGGVVVAWLILLRRLDFPRVRALLLTAPLAFCFGVWRYAGEAEIYGPVLLPVALMAYLALGSLARRRDRMALVAAAVLACGIHVLAVLGAMIAVPAALLYRRGWRTAARYAAMTAVLGSMMAYSGYVLAEHDAPDFVSFYQGGTGVASMGGPAGLLRHGVAAGQVLASGNFLLTFEPFRASLRRILPGRMIEDELYAGVHAPAWIGYAGLVTLIALVASLVYVFVARVPPERTRTRNAALLLGAAWLVSHAIIVASIARPGQPETWMLALFPGWLVFSAGFVGAGTKVKQLAMLALATLAHNGIGGLAVYGSVEGDRDRARGAYLVDHLEQGDAVITAQSPSFARYLTYHVRGTVHDLQFRDEPWLRATVDSTLRHAGRVFATPDVFEPPAYYQDRFPDESTTLRSVMADYRTDFELVQSDEFGGIYRSRGGGETQ